jgi:hypothetical protein
MGGKHEESAINCGKSSHSAISLGEYAMDGPQYSCDDAIENLLRRPGDGRLQVESGYICGEALTLRFTRETPKPEWSWMALWFSM